MEAYAANRQSVELTAIEANPVAEAILCMIADRGPWSGTATELLRALRAHNPLVTDDSHSFPRQPHRLSTEIRRVLPLLRKHGVSISFERHGKAGQRIMIIKPL